MVSLVVDIVISFKLKRVVACIKLAVFSYLYKPNIKNFMADDNFTDKIAEIENKIEQGTEVSLREAKALIKDLQSDPNLPPDLQEKLKGLNSQIEQEEKKEVQKKAKNVINQKSQQDEKQLTDEEVKAQDHAEREEKIKKLRLEYQILIKELEKSDNEVNPILESLEKVNRKLTVDEQTKIEGNVEKRIEKIQKSKELVKNLKESIKYEQELVENKIQNAESKVEKKTFKVEQSSLEVKVKKDKKELEAIKQKQVEDFNKNLKIVEILKDKNQVLAKKILKDTYEEFKLYVGNNESIKFEVQKLAKKLQIDEELGVVVSEANKKLDSKSKNKNELIEKANKGGLKDQNQTTENIVNKLSKPGTKTVNSLKKNSKSIQMTQEQQALLTQAKEVIDQVKDKDKDKESNFVSLVNEEQKAIKEQGVSKNKILDYLCEKYKGSRANFVASLYGAVIGLVKEDNIVPNRGKPLAARSISPAPIRLSSGDGVTGGLGGRSLP